MTEKLFHSDISLNREKNIFMPSLMIIKTLLKCIFIWSTVYLAYIHFEQNVDNKDKLLSISTFHTATARLKHIGIHINPRLRQQLISSQVSVVRRCDVVVCQWLCHILIYLIVFWVEDVPWWTTHVVSETLESRKNVVKVQCYNNHKKDEAQEEGISHHQYPAA